MPGLTGEPVVTTLVCFLHCTRGCGCIGARHSPRPLISGREIHAYLGRIAPRECESVSLRQTVSRRHCEEALRRSNPSFASPSCKMDCFASLAMTAGREPPPPPRPVPRRPGGGQPLCRGRPKKKGGGGGMWARRKSPDDDICKRC